MNEYIKEFLTIAKDIEFYLWEGKPEEKGSSIKRHNTSDLQFELDNIRKRCLDNYNDYVKEYEKR